MANLNFNAHNVEPASNFDPLPAGKYTAAITASEMKPTKNGSGEYLQITLQILEGPYKGRLLWDRLNLKNDNPLTTQIARATLSALCRATGVMTPQDSQELHGLPLEITVKTKTRHDTGEAVNEIRGYSKREAAPGITQPVQASTQTPPWRR